jgi:hypothetical protein
MISHLHVKHLDEPPHAELDKNRRITPRNGVGNNTSNTIEGYVVQTEAQDKIINVLDVLLVGFGRKECHEEPTLIRDLPYVSNLGKCGNAFTHNHCLPLAVDDFLDCNGTGGSGINNPDWFSS